VGTVVGILGLVLSTVFFFLPNFVAKDAAGKQLEGILSSSISTTQSLRRQIQDLNEMADLQQQDKMKVKSVYLPGQLKDEQLLQKLTTDGMLFGRLSGPFQKQLPIFLRNRRVFIAALNPDKPDLSQRGTLWLLLLELRTEEACLVLEQRFQKGEIDVPTHEKLFNDMLAQQSQEIMRKLQKPEK